MSSRPKSVHAEDMIRQCVGEDLKIGANLTWGPCFDYQKQFFCALSIRFPNTPTCCATISKVSGFGSHESGHLCCLRLKEQIYPGGDSKDHWPKLCLNTLRWAQKNKALVCGPAHSGWGLEVPGDELPNYNVPPFSGLAPMSTSSTSRTKYPGPEASRAGGGFLSMGDTPYVWELTSGRVPSCVTSTMYSLAPIPLNGGTL